MGYLRQTSLSLFAQLGKTSDAEILRMIFQPYQRDYMNLLGDRKCHWDKVGLVGGYLFFLANAVTIPLLIYYLVEDFTMKLEIICGILTILLMIVSTVTMYRVLRESVRPSVRNYWKLCTLFRKLYQHREWLKGICDVQLISSVSFQTPHGIFNLNIDNEKFFCYSGEKILIIIQKYTDSIVDNTNMLMEFGWIKYGLNDIPSYETELDHEYFFHLPIRREFFFQCKDWQLAQEQIKRLDLYQRIFAADMLLNNAAEEFWQIHAPGELEYFWSSLHNPSSTFYRYLAEKSRIPKEIPLSNSDVSTEDLISLDRHQYDRGLLTSESEEDISLFSGTSSSRELPTVKQVRWSDDV